MTPTVTLSREALIEKLINEAEEQAAKFAKVVEEKKNAAEP